MFFDFSHSISEAKRAIDALDRDEAQEFFSNVMEKIINCYEREGKLLIAGNGGSLCDAMHFAEELTGFFRKERRPLAALALSDPGHMSCVSNDAGFEHVFERQVEALGREEDLLIILSTSGNSKNLVLAAQAAKKKNIPVIGFLGRGGGLVKELCSLFWCVEGFPFSDRIQEAHMAAIHMIIEAIEECYVFSGVASVETT